MRLEVGDELREKGRKEVSGGEKGEERGDRQREESRIKRDRRQEEKERKITRSSRDRERTKARKSELLAPL